MKHNRIYIIGSGGSGKSYFADLLSDKFGVPHYHLDDINWAVKYIKARKQETKIKKLKKIIKKRKWITEGAYVSWISEAIRKADVVVWLYPHEFLMAYRVIIRFLRRKFSKNPPENKLSDIISGTLFVLGYKLLIKEGSGKTRYERHKELIENHKANFILIRNKKEIKNFVESLS